MKVMKVLQINIFGNLSTGRIAVDLYNVLKENGHDGLVAYARNTISNGVPHYVIGSMKNVYIDALFTRITDRAGFFSTSATVKLIEKIKQYDPDVIHLHNLHGYYINVEVLFDYLQKMWENQLSGHYTIVGLLQVIAVIFRQSNAISGKQDVINVHKNIVIQQAMLIIVKTIT